MNTSCLPFIIVDYFREQRGRGEILRSITDIQEVQEWPPWQPRSQTVTNWWWLCQHQISQVVPLRDWVINVIINRSVHTDNSLQYKENITKTQWSHSTAWPASWPPTTTYNEKDFYLVTYFPWYFSHDNASWPHIIVTIAGVIIISIIIGPSVIRCRLVMLKQSES